MLINMEEMLKIADQNQFAVGAFNATESSLFRAVVERQKHRMHQLLCRQHQVNLILPRETFINM